MFRDRRRLDGASKSTNGSALHFGMQLRDARLCADCDEVHDAQQCPHCASERFSYLSRWVPLPADRLRPRPTSSPEAEVYRQLINPEAHASGNSRGLRRVKHGVMSVAAVGVLGWLWQTATRARDAKDTTDDKRKTSQ
jgi:hypothetical protein